MNPLQRPLEIKLFNEKWFSGHLPTKSPIFFSCDAPTYVGNPPDWQKMEHSEHDALIEKEDSAQVYSPGTIENMYIIV
jgi:hypothetical protein